MTEADYRFIFRGNAVAASGHIRRPEDRMILSQAPAGVAVNGGYSLAEVKGSDFGEIFRFTAARSEVRADYQDPAKAVEFTYGNHAQNRLPTRTTVSTWIEGISMINGGPSGRRVLSCGKITGELQSEWPGSNRQTSIRLPAAAIDGLKLDDHELEVTFHSKLFSDKDTKYKLHQAYEGNDTFFRNYGHLFFAPAGQVPKSRLIRKLPEAGGIALCTIVESIRWKGEPNPNAEIQGNKIVFKDFGSLYLGELLVSDFSRRLTMMRIQFGSPDGGDVSFAEVETNGVGYPP
jgi:hypothetical protein